MQQKTCPGSRVVVGVVNETTIVTDNSQTQVKTKFLFWVSCYLCHCVGKWVVLTITTSLNQGLPSSELYYTSHGILGSRKSNKEELWFTSGNAVHKWQIETLSNTFSVIWSDLLRLHSPCSRQEAQCGEDGMICMVHRIVNLATKYLHKTLL